MTKSFVFEMVEIRTYHVDGEFTEIGIQLTWESEASGNTGHGGRDQMVQITIGWGGEFECSELQCYTMYVLVRCPGHPKV